MLRRLFRLVIVLAVIAIVAVAAVWTIANTDFGRERARREVVSLLASNTHGIIRIGKMNGDILNQATLVGVTITDSAGHPFFTADSISLHYRIRSFFAKRLEFGHVVLYRPDVVVARSPTGGDWNYRVLWPATPKSGPGDTIPSWGSWVKLTNVTAIDGNVTVWSPWSPREGLSKRARDSVVKAALRTDSRLDIYAVPGGYQKLVTLQHVNAKVPLVRWADPAYRSKYIQVSDLNMEAYPFRPPAAQVRTLAGAFNFDDDSLWWKGAHGSMPRSAFKGDGVYNLNSGDMRVSLAASPASFVDFKWLYEHLPDNGGGNLGMTIQWKGATQDYVLRDADLRTGSAHIQGDIGVSMSDTVYFHDANLRLSGLTTKQIEAAAPGNKAPREGVIGGRAKFSGTAKRLKLDADLTFDAYGRGRSRAIADGTVGFSGNNPVVVTADNLHVRVAPLQIDIVKLLFPTLPVEGTLTGVTTMNGSGATELVFSNLDVVHQDGANISHAVGSASAHTIGRRTLDLDVDARPFALAELTRFAPSLPLKGFARGPVHAHGPIDSLMVDTDVRLSGGGHLALTGPVDFLSAELGYDVAANVSALDLSRVVINGPVTSLSGTGHASGRGFLPATMVSNIALALGPSSVDTIGVDSLTLRARLSDGLANVDSARLAAKGTSVDVQGQLGLDSLHSGTLKYAVAVDSLVTFARFIPGATAPDTGVVVPRPRRAFEELRRARADSARVAKATEVQRAVANAPGVKLRIPVDTPRVIPKGTLAGMLRAQGTISGSLTHFALDGSASGTGIIVQGNSTRHFDATYGWADVRTMNSQMSLKLRADTVSAAGFLFDSLTTDLTYTAPTGSVAIRVRQGKERDYSLSGAFSVDTARDELRLANVALRFDSTSWTSTQPSTIRFGRSGVEVLNFELQNGPGRRIYANGLLPTKGEANFDLNVTDFAVENIAELLQSDLALTGRLNLDAHVSGSSENPQMSGKLDFTRATYNDVRVPDVHDTFTYADQKLTSTGSAIDSTGRTVASLSGTLPINLALSGVTGSRLVDAPVAFTLKSDSLPLQLIPEFTSAVASMGGHAYGNVSVAGTLKRPALTGEIKLADVHFTIPATGAIVQHVNGDVRMTGDTVFIDSIAGISNGPVRLSGTVAVGNWRDPSFDLVTTARDAQFINTTALGEVHADADLHLTGAVTAPTIAGQVTVLHGVLYIPESSGKQVIGSDDPSLFSVVDTTIAMQRDLFPAASPMFRNLKADVTFSVERNTWFRSRDANVEVFTDDPMSVNIVGDALTLTGAVNADRGEYTFLSRRFQITRGTALFIGTPDLNPTLQVTAEYQVKQPTGVTNIKVLVGGTLEAPRISLESDAQPPLSQSDLLSYLAFGQGSSTLLQVNQSSLSSTQGALNAAGTRLAGVALGVALDELKGGAARSLGFDVLDITPGDIPITTQGAGFDQFFRGTEVDAGRYVTPRTFLSFDFTPGALAALGCRGQNSVCAPPGLSLTQRSASGLRLDLGYSPHYFLDPPSLAGQSFSASGQFGAFLLREWRF